MKIKYKRFPSPSGASILILYGLESCNDVVELFPSPSGASILIPWNYFDNNYSNSFHLLPEHQFLFSNNRPINR